MEADGRGSGIPVLLGQRIPPETIATAGSGPRVSLATADRLAFLLGQNTEYSGPAGATPHTIVAQAPGSGAQGADTSPVPAPTISVRMATRIGVYAALIGIALRGSSATTHH